jgi:hypothetical protein
MKKIILSAIIAFSIGSCSNDDDTTTPTNATNKFADVSAKFGSSETSLTGKPVLRPATVPVSIDQITVAVVNVNPAVTTPSTVFDFGTGAGYEQTKYYIDNVTSGSNTFTATATTTGTAGFTVTVQTSKTEADAVIANDQAKTPYAQYTDLKVVDIVLGQAQSIPFNLTTNQGRLIIQVASAPILTAMGRKIELTGNRYDAAGTQMGAGQTLDITGNKTATFYWNDVNSVSTYKTAGAGNVSNTGARIDYAIHIYNAAGTTVEKTYARSYYIKGSTSKTVLDVVTYEGITESINEAVFTVEKWEVE